MIGSTRHLLLRVYPWILTLCIAHNSTQYTGCLAADGTGDLAPPVEYQSTSVDEVQSANPIRLRVVRDAPSWDLPETTGPVGVTDAVQTGVKNNFTLKESEESWKGSKFLARAALAKMGPSASFNTFFSSSSLNQMLFFPGDTSVASPPMQPIVKGTSLSLMFAGTQPLFTGGRLLGGYKAARAVERQSLASFREQRITTALKVKESYWNSAWNEARLRVASDYVKFREGSTHNMKVRMDEGKVPRADYLREEAELAKARIQLNESYRDFNTALLNLKVAMAINLGSQIALKDPLEFIETKGDLGTFLLDAARNRPEIARATSRVVELRAKRTIVMSKYSPQVNLYGLGSSITGSNPDNNSSGKVGGVVGIVGGVTLWDSGARFNELRATNAAVRQSELVRRETELMVAQEVSQAWIDLDLARRNVTLARDEVTSADEDYRLFHVRYQVGKSIALEEFEAAVKMFQARLTLLEAIYKHRLAEARLVYASGGI